MRGVVFDLSLPRYALARGLGRWLPSLYTGPASCLSLRELPDPVPPGPGWLRLRPIAAGVCGSDVAAITLHTSPVLEPLSSMPCVLGHEILARAEEGTGDVRAGDRVVVEPLLACALRGVAPACPACVRGEENRCESFARGHLAPGMMLGFHRDLPGGWSERLVAHGRQLHRVPDDVPDRRAVLTEPLAVAAHAVLATPPATSDRVLVIGGGMIGMAVLGALRLLELRPEVLAHLTVLPYQAELGRALGATHALGARGSGAAELAAEVRELTGAAIHRPLLGGPLAVGGFERVYDCVGTRASLDVALRYARAGGTVVLLGAAAVIEALDWTFVWSKELTVRGTFCYGREARAGGRPTFEVVLERLTDETLAAPLDALVTHDLPLERYREAIEANLDRAHHRSVKTILRPEAAR